MEAYLETREQLAGVVQLVDLRHGPTELDRAMIEWLEAKKRPMLLAATKQDKLGSPRDGLRSKRSRESSRREARRCWEFLRCTTRESRRCGSGSRRKADPGASGIHDAIARSRNIEMSVRVLVGAQWGDEGKGKIVDYLMQDAKIVARFGGGPNAGHTVVIGGKKTVLHHIPSGVLHPGVLCLLGNGVVIDTGIFQDEIKRLEDGGVNCDGRVFVSPRAHLILRTHRILDRLAEEARGDRAIGTTGKGIGPTYGDKVLRRGVRIGDLEELDALAERVREEVQEVGTSDRGRALRSRSDLNGRSHGSESRRIDRRGQHRAAAARTS